MRQKMFYWGVIFSLLVSGCGGDNAYDGKNGLGGSSTASGVNVLESIQKNILSSNAETLLVKLSEVEETLSTFDANLTKADIEGLQEDFTAIINSWKKVEALYVASEYDDELRTMPINIDVFNKGKNLDVAKNINYVLNLEGELKVKLLTRPSKTITGLEYLLFGNQASIADLIIELNKNDKKRIEVIKIAIDKVKSNVVLIKNFYKNDTKFKANLEETLNILVNTLVQSTFDLRELRIGEAAGFINKTKDDPKAERLEYYRSKKSLVAIKSILVAHKQIMGKQSFSNFGSFASEKGADAVVKKIQANINNALAITEEFSAPIQEGITPAKVDTKVKRLYDEITDLQKNYFESLINALNLTADIIEADGD